MAITTMVDGGIASTTASTATGVKEFIPTIEDILILITVPAQPNTSY